MIVFMVDSCDCQFEDIFPFEIVHFIQINSKIVQCHYTYVVKAK